MPPFKLEPPPAPPGDPGIVRGDGGLFMRREQPPAPPQIVRMSSDQGRDVDEVIAENRAPDHPRPPGAPRTEANEIPWADLGPTYNDARRPPMRLDGGKR